MTPRLIPTLGALYLLGIVRLALALGGGLDTPLGKLPAILEVLIGVAYLTGLLLNSRRNIRKAAP